ncbi:MAG: histidine phosphatase family protein [Thermomicrobiales bacterium]|nr:histidine phosphatase family protein [Thermomicrobiales bacterium]
MIQFDSPSLHLVHPSGSETELFFVRHGQTSANVQRLYAGSTDVPLDDMGRYQASRVAERFRDIAIDAIVSSPLQRAHYTAQQIGLVTGHVPVLMTGIQEMHFGDAEMLTLDEVNVKWPRLMEQETNLGLTEFRWPNGESDIEFTARVVDSMNSVMRDYPNQRVAVVCHGGVIAQVLNYLNNGDRGGNMQYSIANCSITHLHVSSRETIIHYWNDHSHLEYALGSIDIEDDIVEEAAS